LSDIKSRLNNEIKDLIKSGKWKYRIP
jgi:hypothetical protein